MTKNDLLVFSFVFEKTQLRAHNKQSDHMFAQHALSKNKHVWLLSPETSFRGQNYFMTGCRCLYK